MSSVPILQRHPNPLSFRCSLADFQIEKKIGRGQFSEVYKATCLLDRKTVALKKVQVSQRPRGVRAFCVSTLWPWARSCPFLLLPFLCSQDPALWAVGRIRWAPDDKSSCKP